jgi:nitrogen regulatory protein PII
MMRSLISSKGSMKQQLLSRMSNIYPSMQSASIICMKDVSSVLKALRNNGNVTKSIHHISTGRWLKKKLKHVGDYTMKLYNVYLLPHNQLVILVIITSVYPTPCI